MSRAYFFALLEEAMVENALVSRGRVKMNQAQSASNHIEDLAKINDLEACFDLTIFGLLMAVLTFLILWAQNQFQGIWKNKGWSFSSLPSDGSTACWSER